jgi:hypothetical protein|nr:MAG TPA_asm: hypothetical protein [Caudoviricetes sp.]
MAEYIDREELLTHQYNASHSNWPQLAEMVVGVEDIEDAPAADVALVVHGRWNSMDGYKTRRACSVCGWDVPEYGKFYSYCPNCGAKMDGGDGDAAD